ncbi:MAG: SpoIID/LytB domain-containing protein [Candidatus Omnitrophica bacterium]|nr:SpoIID/LytB domain-containing protein [Candidatus Omnitrophota bacterium]
MTAGRRRVSTWAVACVLLAVGWASLAIAGDPLAREPHETIRVAVVQREPFVRLAIHGRFRITGAQPQTALHDGPRLATTSVRAADGGILLGDQLLSAQRLRVEPSRDATIDLNGHRLRGMLEILRQPDATLLVVNHVDLEDYLRGVLSKEAPHYWPSEALKALAITARTYALYQRLSKDTVNFDVTSDVLSQIYGGRSAERWRTNRAVRATTGMILVFGDRVFPAFYSSTCGGITEQGSAMGPYDIPPLKGGIACRFCSGSPFYRWRQRVSYADIGWAIKQQRGETIWPVQAVESAAFSPTGRVQQLRIRGARTLLLTGYEFRQLLGFDRIRSTAFTVVPDGDGVILEGRGWGHGVGLCQWGAAELARQGRSAREILELYYPTAKLVKLGEVPIQPIAVQTKGGS